MLDYELIDSGDFEKLERYGKYFLRRPEPQAVWPKALELSEWERLTNAWFRKNGSDQASESFERGEWVTGKAMPDRWVVDYKTTAGTLKLRLAMTAEIRRIFTESPEEFDPRKYLGPARDAIQKMVQHKIKNVLGASNQR